MISSLKFLTRMKFSKWFIRHLVLISAVAGILGIPAYAAGAVLVGQQLITSTVDYNSAGVAEAFRASASASGTVTSLSVYIDAGSTATRLIAGLYTDKSGTPGNLLAQGSLSSPVAGTWNTVPIPNTNVTAGNIYWIAILGPASSGKLQFRDSDPNGTRSETSSQGNLTSLPSTWSTGRAWNSSPVSAYGSAAAASQPILSVSPSSLVFSATQGGPDPLPASLSVDNTGAGTLSFTGSTDASWLSLSPSSGTAPPAQTVQVGATVGSLTAGSYTGSVIITAASAQGSPATVPVTLNVTSSTPPPGTGSDWLTYGHDPQRSGNAAGESVITTSSVKNLALKWSAAVDGKVTGQPLFVSAVQVGGQAQDVVVVATSNNSIYALDASTGAQLWRSNFGPPSGQGDVPGGFGISASPVIDRVSNRIYTVSDDGYLRTLNLADGTQASAAVQVITDNPGTNSVWGGLNLVAGNLYIATGSNGPDTNPWWGRIIRVNVSGAAPVVAATFKVVPSVAAPYGGGGIWGYGGVSVDPATGRVYAATGADDRTPEGYTLYSGSMIALAAGLGNPPLGNPLGYYQPAVPSPCQGDPGVCDMDFGATPIIFQPAGCPTLVAAIKKDGKIYLFKADDLAASAPPLQSLALNIAYDGPGAGGLTGIPAYWPTGNMLFVTDGGPGINGINAGVVALNVSPAPVCNLQVAWSVALPAASDQPPSSPTVANGVVFVGSGLNGSIHAYDATTGVELWNSGSAIPGGATFAAPMVASGTLFTASWNGFNAGDGGTVRAFAPGSNPPPPPPPPSNVLLGDQVIESQADYNPLGMAEAFQATASASGTVSKLSVYVDASSTATTLVAGLYADSAGHPGALIAQGSSSQLTDGAWNTVTIPGAIVTAGNPYWIAILGTQSGTLRFRDVSGGCHSETSVQSNLTSLPSSWVTGGVYSTCPLSAYGTAGP